MRDRRSIELRAWAGMRWIVSDGPRTASARGLERLPIAAVLVPDPDVWRVEGAGRTLVARRRRDGRIAWASAAIDLKRPADLALFGKLDAEADEFEDVLAGLCGLDDCPPMIGGSAALAGRFAWGGYAYARARGLELGSSPAADELALLALFERPGTDDGAARRWFDGPEGLVDRELLEFCRREERAELRRGLDLATIVSFVFRLEHPERVARSLATDATFEPEPPRGNGSVELAWIPAGPDGRTEVRGRVTLEAALLSAETVSLTLAGALCAAIKRHADGAVELVSLERRRPAEPVCREPTGGAA